MSADKASIRASALQRRDALAPALRSAHGGSIIARICALPQFDAAQVVMAYSGFGNEIDTSSLLDAIRKAGKKLAMPRIVKATGLLDVLEVNDPQTDLLEGVWGIREPDPARCRLLSPQEIDLVIMPGAVFDRKGGRIGYGKGYYDKLLAQCQQHGRVPTTVAGAFDVQVVDEVPVEAHDMPVDVLVTEREVLVMAAGGVNRRAASA